MDIIDKLLILRQVIKAKKKMAVAFSGGIDSSLVAKVALLELADQAVAVTIDSDFFTRRELAIAKRIAAEIGIEHHVVRVSELDNQQVAKNPVNRCYYCKHDEFSEIAKIAREKGISTIAYGVNMSDFGEHRPGILALKEKGVFFPLVEAGIAKNEIPLLAKQLGLSNYNLPSTTCLASRIPYNTPIDQKKLTQIEQAEDFIYSLGIEQCRVRHYDQTARIEVSAGDMATVLARREDVVSFLNGIGYIYVTLDLKGYCSGSMNQVLPV
jgi:uncharacterized protein